MTLRVDRGDQACAITLVVAKPVDVDLVRPSVRADLEAFGLTKVDADVRREPLDRRVAGAVDVPHRLWRTGLGVLTRHRIRAGAARCSRRPRGCGEYGDRPATSANAARVVTAKWRTRPMVAIIVLLLRACCTRIRTMTKLPRRGEGIRAAHDEPRRSRRQPRPELHNETHPIPKKNPPQRAQVDLRRSEIRKTEPAPAARGHPFSANDARAA